MPYLQWVIEDQLARSSRPGYPGENVSPAEVADWITKVHGLGVKTIICLLSQEQLGFYSRLPEGLLAEYQQQGFGVAHIPITDPYDDPAGYQELEQSLESIYQRFQSLPKPALIHCSAGIDRTGRTVRYILDQLDNTRDE